MDLIYLDYNCFQRRFDDPNQIRIQIGKFSAKDILYVACASYAQANFFLTCDDALMRQAKKLALACEIMNPVDYIRRETP